MRVLVRCDAGSVVGLGHVMRCLAIAQACRERGVGVSFLMPACPGAIRERLGAEGFDLFEHGFEPGSQADADDVARCSGEYAGLVIDSYAFDRSALEVLLVRCEAERVLRLDDSERPGSIVGEMVLDQSVESSPGVSADVLLLGPRFALLRAEHLGADRRERTAGGRPSVLVTMGGADPAGMTLRAVEGLGRVEGVGAVRVLVGAVNRRADEVRRACEALGFEAVRSAADMATVLRETEIVLSAAGSTCWEACYHGCALAVWPIADNQRPVGALLDRHGAAMVVGQHEDVTADDWAAAAGRLVRDEGERAGLSSRASDLVDGHGAARAAMRLLGSPIRLRRADSGDCERFWLWANEPGVRRQSFTTEPIAWEDHRRWFAARLGDARSLLLVGHDAEDRAIGQVRFQWDEGGVGTISVSVDPSARGRGLAAVLIDLGCRGVFARAGLVAIDAYIRRDNTPSVRAFARAGFGEPMETVHEGTASFVMTRRGDG